MEIPAAAEVVFVTNTQRVVRLPVDSVTLLERWNGRTHPLTKPNEKNYHRHPTGINIKLTNPAFIKRSVLTIVAQVVLENVYKAFPSSA